MRRLKVIILSLGILNILAGGILAIFTILMQNPLSLLVGTLYIIFGISVLINKINKKILFFGIIPLTILFSLNTILLTIDRNTPKYFNIPFYTGLLIILPLWLLIFGDIRNCNASH